MEPGETSSVLLATAEARRWLDKADTDFVNGKLEEAQADFGLTEKWANRAKFLVRERRRERDTLALLRKGRDGAAEEWKAVGSDETGRALCKHGNPHPSAEHGCGKCVA